MKLEYLVAIVVILMHTAITRGTKGELEETPARMPKATTVNLSQLFLYLRGLDTA